MQISKLITQRNTITANCMQIVYEWEDIIAKELNLSFIDDLRSENQLYKKLASSQAVRLLNMAVPTTFGMFTTNEPSLAFELNGWREPGHNKSNIIPCIIDFHIRSKHHLKAFHLNYWRNPLVLISNLEALEFLKNNNCRLPLRHWGLSIPDQWVSRSRIQTEKTIDVIIMGRVNPILYKYLQQYRARHPNLIAALPEQTGKHISYKDSNGNFLGFSDTREQYMHLLSLSRAGLYCTPGMDNARIDAHGFNQVTPRFLEHLCGGCHVLARYEDNPDTRFYDLNEMTARITDYDSFEKSLDQARAEPVDVDKYFSYLNKHTTSARAKELTEIIRGI